MPRTSMASRGRFAHGVVEGLITSRDAPASRKVVLADNEDAASEAVRHHLIVPEASSLAMPAAIQSTPALQAVISAVITWCWKMPGRRRRSGATLRAERRADCRRPPENLDAQPLPPKTARRSRASRLIRSSRQHILKPFRCCRRRKRDSQLNQPGCKTHVTEFRAGVRYYHAAFAPVPGLRIAALRGRMSTAISTVHVTAVLKVPYSEQADSGAPATSPIESRDGLPASFQSEYCRRHFRLGATKLRPVAG